MPEYSGPLQTVVENRTLWLIPLLPFLGAVLNAVVGWRLQKTDHGKELSKKLHIGSFPISAIAVGSMIVSFALAVWHVLQVIAQPEDRRFLFCHLWQMVRVGSIDFSFALSLDTTSSVMLLVVTGVGLLIHIYATGYMATEPSYWRFFSYFNLFIFSMLLLVLGDNFIVMFFGWEGVGLCSYLLIGFWYKDYKKATAGTKAFLTNRVGDFGFISGMALLMWGLTGSWGATGDFLPDQTPRLVAATVEEAQEGAEGHGEHRPAAQHAGKSDQADKGERDRAHEHGDNAAAGRPEPFVRPGKAWLTFTAFPGAKVYVDNNTAEPLVAPFVRKELTAQRHDFRVVMGGATDDLTLVHTLLADGKETILTPVGAIFSFRELHNQMVVRDDKGRRPFREGLAGKSLWGVAVITLACIGFFIGATGKSAQIPLYVWLPDAMAGPTPVSALIHAATMVTSGVYMVARLNFLFSMSPTASGIVATVGALTALFAATIGFFQYDIKKVLAYSTVSQLGFMFIGVGVGAYWAGIFHLMTHAFFKACLFLGSGSVIHGMHAVEHDADRAQDMRIMGGLKKVMPLTRGTYLVACLAITAAPIPLFAGFWSKDEILWKAFTSENIGAVPGPLIWLIGLTAALGTSFYMWRSYYLTFEGKPATKEIPDKVHESPPVMTYVLVVLAFLSTVGGALFGFSTHFVGGHGEPLLEKWLEPALRHAEVKFHPPVSFLPELALEHTLMWGSVLAAIGMWYLARKRYGAGRSESWEADERKLPAFTLLHNKYYVDEIYHATVIRGVIELRLILRDMDKWVIDGVVNGAGRVARAVAFADGAFDKYVVDGLVNLVAGIVLRAGARIRRLQTGQIQNYAYGLLGGVATLAVILSLIQYYAER